MSSSGGSFGNGDGDYLLVISGSVRTYPYLATWQVFKDHVRKIVSEQPGWVDICVSPGLKKGHLQGWVKLKSAEDADACYKVFYKAKDMLVHVWETHRNTPRFKIWRCNCFKLFPNIREGEHSYGQCGIDMGRVDRLREASSLNSIGAYMAVQPVQMYSAHSPTQTYTIAAYPLQVPAVAPYSGSATSLSSIQTNGTVRPGGHSIFVWNLHPQSTREDVYSLLSVAEQPFLDYRLHGDPAAGTFQGQATVELVSNEAAQRLVQRLHGVNYMDMVIGAQVKTTAIAQDQHRAPLVVNGS